MAITEQQIGGDTPQLDKKPYSLAVTNDGEALTVSVVGSIGELLKILPGKNKLFAASGIAALMPTGTLKSRAIAKGYYAQRSSLSSDSGIERGKLTVTFGVLYSEALFTLNGNTAFISQDTPTTKVPLTIGKQWVEAFKDADDAAQELALEYYNAIVDAPDLQAFKLARDTAKQDATLTDEQKAAIVAMAAERMSGTEAVEWYLHNITIKEYVTSEPGETVFKNLNKIVTPPTGARNGFEYKLGPISTAQTDENEWVITSSYRGCAQWSRWCYESKIDSET